MLRIKQAVIAGAGLLVLFQAGCLLNHSNHIVLRQDEPLRALTFQSESSRKVFEEAVDCALDEDSLQSHASFGIPFIIGLSKSKTLSSTAIRNDVGALFDINQDGVISDYEVSLRSQ